MSTKIIISEDKSFIQELLNKISACPIFIIVDDVASIQQLKENCPVTLTSPRNNLKVQ